MYFYQNQSKVEYENQIFQLNNKKEELEKETLGLQKKMKQFEQEREQEQDTYQFTLNDVQQKYQMVQSSYDQLKEENCRIQ